MGHDRSILRITGADRHGFLQGLVTNAVPEAPGSLAYAALLTPQGKYLADFFLWAEDEALFLDADRDQAPDLLKRLSLYKLRSKVAIEVTGITAVRGTGPVPEGAMTDPRHPSLGWRLYGADAKDDTDWDALRVAHCIPEAGRELIPDETYILEAGFERLNGVDFKKGCYVGQEVTARMKHKTTLRKGLTTVTVEGDAPIGTPIDADGKAAGVLYTQSGGRGIAYLRFDRATGAMAAGNARVTR
ncbi:MAG: folate-binding protein [Pseudomonadota bacterium]